MTPRKFIPERIFTNKVALHFRIYGGHYVVFYSPVSTDITEDLDKNGSNESLIVTMETQMVHEAVRITVT
jgi:hypothetical protein